MKIIAVFVLITLAASAFAVEGDDQARPIGTTPGRMPAIQRALDALREGTANDAAELAAQLAETVLAPPLILPTKADDTDVQAETNAFYDRACQDFQDAIDALKAANQADTAALLEGALDALAGVAHYVRDIPVVEDGTTPQVDAAIQELLDNGLAAPIVPYPRSPLRHLPDEVVETGLVRRGLPWVVMKEFFGLVPRVFCRRVPIYAEPWHVRVSPIIGYRKVWYVRWVPHEYIKSIVYTLDDNDRVNVNVQQTLVADHHLSAFWLFYRRHW